jgi:DNA-binding SARP family transcriptional activator
MCGVTRLWLSLLGPFQATLDGAPLAGLRANKGRALLAYLASEAGQPLAREMLSALLWGERPDEAARLSLRVALSGLRKALAPVGALLYISRQAVRFTCDPGLCWLDTAEFDELLAVCANHHQSPSPDCPACAERLARVAELYRGDFLAGLNLPDSPAFDQWQRVRQEHYHQQILVVLEKLGRYYLAAGQFEQAQAHAQRQLALEPWREKAHRQLMRALALGGERCAALAQYETCRRILADELSTKPEVKTSDLYKRIRDGELEPSSAGNLPAQLVPFVGREAELAQISDLLRIDNCRLLTLVGPSGIGKTRLALQAAAQCGPAFAHGACYVPLAHASLQEVLSTALVEALQFPLQHNETDLSQQLSDYLSSQEMLLVLDDYAPLPATAAWVLGLLQHAPHVKIIAVSPVDELSDHLAVLPGLPGAGDRVHDADAGET